MDIRVENLGFVYNKGTPLEVRALSHVSFHLKHGTCLAILGGAGSGKTTLVKHLNGLLKPTEGQVLVDNQDTRKWGSILRRKVGLVFQHPERQLFEETVLADISFVLRRVARVSEKEIEENVDQVCEYLGLDIQEIGERSPLSLSQGIRRKVAIAGVLVNDPEVLILDEPGVGLDPPSLVELRDILGRLKQYEKKSLVIVSHDVESFLPLLDEILVLEKGKVASIGTPHQVCEELGDNERLRPVLPGIALLVRDLQKAGVPIESGNYQVSQLTDQIARLVGGAT
jgi:energy-coupling factor transport system ATP-binding protein